MLHLVASIPQKNVKNAFWVPWILLVQNKLHPFLKLKICNLIVHKDWKRKAFPNLKHFPSRILKSTAIRVWFFFIPGLRVWSEEKSNTESKGIFAYAVLTADSRCYGAGKSWWSAGGSGPSGSDHSSDFQQVFELLGFFSFWSTTGTAGPNRRMVKLGHLF